MQKVKTSELIDAALDWAVAKCEGWEWRCPWMLEKDGFVVWQRYEAAWGSPTPNYSTDWAQGGPIIEREGIAVSPEIDCIRWYGSVNRNFLDGTTPLIAAMRCYVASKLGDEVEIPKELT